MTLFTKCYPSPLGTRTNNTVPALKTTTVNRPVPALKKNARPGANKKYNRPVPALKNTITRSRPASKKKKKRPVPPRKKNITAPSRLGKKTTAPSRFGKKNHRPVPPRKKKNTRPVPPRILPRKIPSRPVPPRISTPIFCQSRAPAEMKKVGQPSIFPPSRPVEILVVHVKPWKHGRQQTNKIRRNKHTKTPPGKKINNITSAIWRVVRSPIIRWDRVACGLRHSVPPLAVAGSSANSRTPDERWRVRLSRGSSYHLLENIKLPLLQSPGTVGERKAIDSSLFHFRMQLSGSF